MAQKYLREVSDRTAESALVAMAKIMHEIAIGLLRQSGSNNIQTETLEMISDLFKKFIDGDISVRPLLVDVLQREIGSTYPLDKIESVMRVPDEPPPYTSTEDSHSSCLQSSRRKMRPWTEAEDLRLMAAVTRIGLENWVATAAFVGYGRTRSQCSQRWSRGLNPKICRDHWTPEEDEKLISLVKENNPKGWTSVSSGLGNRSDVQCRYRFCHLMKEGRVGEIPPTNELLKGWARDSHTRKSQPCIQIWNQQELQGPLQQRVSIPIPRESHRKSSSDVRIMLPPPETFNSLIEWELDEEEDFYEQKRTDRNVALHLW